MWPLRLTPIPRPDPPVPRPGLLPRLLPNQHQGATDFANEVKTQLVITFVPEDNEEIETLTVNDIPSDVQVFIRQPGGDPADDVQVDHDGSVTVPGSQINNIFIIAPSDADADIPLSFTAVVVDPDVANGGFLVSDDFTVIIDAAADVPTVGSLGEGGLFVGGVIPSVEGTAGDAVAVNLDVVSNDADGSETTAVQLFFTSEQGFDASDFTINAPGAELVEPADGAPFFVIPQESFAGLEIGIPDGAFESINVFAFGVATETEITGAELTFNNNVAVTPKAVAFQITLQGELIVGIANPIFDLVETDTGAEVLTASLAQLGLTTTIQGEDQSDLVESITLDLANLPDGAAVVDGQGATVGQASGGALSVTVANADELHALVLQLPGDFSTVDSGDITGSITVAGVDGFPVANLNPDVVNVTVAVEGDIDVTAESVTVAEDANLVSFTSDDAPGFGLTFNVVDLNLAAVATDVDGSEEVQTATVAFNGAPTGTGVFFFGAAGSTFATVERTDNGDGTENISVSGLTAAELATVQLALPPDYSGEFSGNVVSAFTDEQGTDEAPFSVTVTPTPDLRLPSGEEIGGLGDDQETDAAITVALNLTAEIDDSDGSEVFTSFMVTFDQLPDGTTASTGTLDGLVWTGASLDDLQGLALVLPADYSSEDGGVINGTLAVTTNEGGDQSVDFVVPVLPEADLEVAAQDVEVKETDAPVTINLGAGAGENNAGLSAEAVDLDGSEEVTGVSVEFSGLPEGASVNGGALVGGVWTGTVSELDDLQLTVPADYFGEIQGVLNATTDEGGDESAPFTITVDATPDAVDDQVTVAEDSTDNTIAILPNDDQGDAPATVISTTDPENGTVSINEDGTVSFTPDADFDGQTTFDYTIEDQNGDRSTATVTVIIDPAPDAVDDQVTVAEDSTDNTIAVLPNDDQGDAPATVISATDPENGSVSINEDGTINFTPDPNFDGQTTFQYTIEDQTGDQSTATVTVIIDPAPDAVDDQVTVAEDSTDNTIVVLANDDQGDAPATVISTTDPENGSVSINPDGTVSFTPDANFDGQTTFEYTIEDQTGDQSTATVTVVIDPAPDAVDDEATTDEDTAVVIAVLPNDDQGDAPATVISTTDPANGSVEINEDGTVTFTPDPDFSGQTSFEYTIEDQTGDQSTATVIVVINATPDLELPNSDEIGGSGQDQETDAPITVDLNLSASITDSDGSEVFTSITVTFDQLPTDTTANGGTLDGLVWTGSDAELAALALTFPQDYSSEDGGVIQGTLAVTTNEGGDDSVDFEVPVLAEEDLDVTGGGSGVLGTETDDPVTVNLGVDTAGPNANLSAVVSDLDGSEEVTSVTVTFDSGLPSGIDSDDFNAGSFSAGAWTGTAAELAQLTLTLPADFSGDIAGSVNATSDEGGDETAPFSFTIDPDPDLELPNSDEIGGSGLDRETDAAITVDLNLSASISDSDGSEVFTSITVTFDQLPSGTTANGGTPDGLVWTGSDAELAALALTFPQDYSSEDGGVIQGTLAVTTNEGGDDSVDFEVPVLAEEDLDVTGGGSGVLGTETDDPVTVNLGVDTAGPNANLSAVVSDLDGSEEVTSVTVTFDSGLPSGIDSDDFNAGSFSAGAWTGTAAELAQLTLTLPADFSGDIAGSVNATSDEGGDETAPFSFTIDPDPDLELPNSDEIGGSGLDRETDAAITVDLNLSASISDSDGSEVFTSITVTFDQLPSGTTANGGTPDGLVWTGSDAELAALALTFPQDYSSEDGGVIQGTLAVTTNEGGDDSVDFEVPVLVEEDLDVTANDLGVIQSDDPVIVNLGVSTGGNNAGLSATVDDADGSEEVVSTEVVFTGLPSGITTDSFNAGTFQGNSWVGSAEELALLTLELPGGFSGDIGGQIFGVSDELGAENALFTIRVDAIPQVLGAEDAVVDEDGFLADANVDSGQTGEFDSTESTTASREITVDFSDDVPVTLDGSLRFVDSDALDGQLVDLDGNPVVFSLSTDGQTLTGATSNGPVLTLQIQTGASEVGGVVVNRHAKLTHFGGL